MENINDWAEKIENVLKSLEGRISELEAAQATAPDALCTLEVINGVPSEGIQVVAGEHDRLKDGLYVWAIRNMLPSTDALKDLRKTAHKH